MHVNGIVVRLIQPCVVLLHAKRAGIPLARVSRIRAKIERGGLGCDPN